MRFRKTRAGGVRADVAPVEAHVLGQCAADLLARIEGGRLVLDRDDADAWLGCLNDLRLVLGTRLGVTEQTDADDLDDDDPRRQALEVYGWLGWLQESLISCLAPRR